MTGAVTVASSRWAQMRRARRRPAQRSRLRRWQEIAQVEAEIDRIEAQTIERLAVPPDNSGPASRAAR